jgi:hypothetical protein
LDGRDVPEMKGPEHQVMWTSITPPGNEYSSMSRAAKGWRLKGTLARQSDQGLATLTYDIVTDAAWRTKKVRVEELVGGNHRLLEIDVKEGHWKVGGIERPDLRGCEDVDLEASPATNTLPLKRMMLRIGARAEVRVAWVRFPSLVVQPLDQSYERIGRSNYFYRSKSGFKAELDLDKFGLVRRYGKFWTV